jgi:hypothetical protein
MGEEIAKKELPRLCGIFVRASALYPSQPRLGATRDHLTALPGLS